MLLGRSTVTDYFSNLTTLRIRILHAVQTMWLWPSSHQGKGSFILFLNLGIFVITVQTNTLWLLSHVIKSDTTFAWFFSLGCFLLEPKHHAVRICAPPCGETCREKDSPPAPMCQTCEWAILKENPPVPAELSHLTVHGTWANPADSCATS